MADFVVVIAGAAAAVATLTRAEVPETVAPAGDRELTVAVLRTVPASTSDCRIA